ncbi:unnamed protein product [Cylicocyclus nassatus]|uniref:Uncharacterized protein n=1 Tax=Cylicocyclus nassatus TaxID=53992 RepID=A0AA36HFJ8_CYLNA|nr:unnamed protein product [Cylicocyclus nassatus]
MTQESDDLLAMVFSAPINLPPTQVKSEGGDVVVTSSTTVETHETVVHAESKQTSSFHQESHSESHQFSSGGHIEEHHSIVESERDRTASNAKSAASSVSMHKTTDAIGEAKAVLSQSYGMARGRVASDDDRSSMAMMSSERLVDAAPPNTSLSVKSEASTTVVPVRSSDHDAVIEQFKNLHRREDSQTKLEGLEVLVYQEFEGVPLGATDAVQVEPQRVLYKDRDVSVHAESEGEPSFTFDKVDYPAEPVGTDYFTDEPQLDVYREEKTATTTTTRVETSDYKNGYRKETQSSNASSIKEPAPQQRSSQAQWGKEKPYNPYAEVVESKESLNKSDDEVSVPHVVRPRVRDDPRPVVLDRGVYKVTEYKFKSRSDQDHGGEFIDDEAKRQAQTRYTYEERNRGRTDTQEEVEIRTRMHDSPASTLVRQSTRPNMDLPPNTGAVKYLRDRIEMSGNNNNEQKKTTKRIDIFESLNQTRGATNQYNQPVEEVRVDERELYDPYADVQRSTFQSKQSEQANQRVVNQTSTRQTYIQREPQYQQKQVTKTVTRTTGQNQHQNSGPLQCTCNQCAIHGKQIANASAARAQEMQELSYKPAGYGTYQNTLTQGSNKKGGTVVVQKTIANQYEDNRAHKRSSSVHHVEDTTRPTGVHISGVVGNPVDTRTAQGEVYTTRTSSYVPHDRYDTQERQMTFSPVSSPTPVPLTGMSRDEKFNSVRVVKNVRAFVNEWGQKDFVPPGIGANAPLSPRAVVSPTFSETRVTSTMQQNVTQPAQTTTITTTQTKQQTIINREARELGKGDANVNQQLVTPTAPVPAKRESVVVARARSASPAVLEHPLYHHDYHCCCCPYMHHEHYPCAHAHQHCEFLAHPPECPYCIQQQQQLHLQQPYKAPQKALTYKSQQKVQPTLKYENYATIPKVEEHRLGTQQPPEEHREAEEEESFTLVPVSVRRADYEQKSGIPKKKVTNMKPMFSLGFPNCLSTFQKCDNNFQQTTTR